MVKKATLGILGGEVNFVNLQSEKSSRPMFGDTEWSCAVIRYKCLQPVSSEAQMNLTRLESSDGKNSRMSVTLIL